MVVIKNLLIALLIIASLGVSFYSENLSGAIHALFIGISLLFLIAMIIWESPKDHR